MIYRRCRDIRRGVGSIAIIEIASNRTSASERVESSKDSGLTRAVQSVLSGSDMVSKWAEGFSTVHSKRDRREMRWEPKAVCRNYSVAENEQADDESTILQC